MAQNSRPVLGLVVTVLVFGGVIAAMVSVRRIGARVAPRVQAFFGDYLKALDEGRFDDAYQRFHNAHYRERVSLEQFRSAWQARLAEHGKLAEHTLVGDATKSAVIGRYSGYSQRVRLRFARPHELMISYDLADADGSFSIERALPSNKLDFDPLYEAW